VTGQMFKKFAMLWLEYINVINGTDVHY